MAEPRDFNPDDTLFRSHGFRIVERPTGGTAIWARGRRTFRQPDALAIIRAEEADRKAIITGEKMKSTKK